jgi:hypothetical protein
MGVLPLCAASTAAVPQASPPGVLYALQRAAYILLCTVLCCLAAPVAALLSSVPEAPCGMLPC